MKNIILVLVSLLISVSMTAKAENVLITNPLMLLQIDKCTQKDFKGSWYSLTLASMTYGNIGAKLMPEVRLTLDNEGLLIDSKVNSGGFKNNRFEIDASRGLALTDFIFFTLDNEFSCQFTAVSFVDDVKEIVTTHELVNIPLYNCPIKEGETIPPMPYYFYGNYHWETINGKRVAVKDKDGICIKDVKTERTVTQELNYVGVMDLNKTLFNIKLEPSNLHFLFSTDYICKVDDCNIYDDDGKIIGTDILNIEKIQRYNKARYDIIGQFTKVK